MNKEKGVDVICYGKRSHFDTRDAAIKFYTDCMSCSEGSERERYTKIFLELTRTRNPVVSDGEPELKKKPTTKSYTIDDKEEILSLIAENKLSVNSNTLYDIGKCKLIFEDKDVIKALLKQDGWYAAQYLRKYIENDPELILLTVENNCHKGPNKGQIGHGLVYASDSLRDNKELVAKVVSINGSELKYASEGLRNDPEIAFIAISQNPEATQYVGSNLIMDLLVDHIDIDRIRCGNNKAPLNTLLQNAKKETSKHSSFKLVSDIKKER